jgi:hypothetical protein
MADAGIRLTYVTQGGAGQDGCLWQHDCSAGTPPISRTIQTRGWTEQQHGIPACRTLTTASGGSALRCSSVSNRARLVRWQRIPAGSHTDARRLCVHLRVLQ